MGTLRLADRSVDLDTGTVSDGSVLRPIELEMLRYLARRPNVFVAQDDLLREVWGYAARVHSRTAYVTMHRLRSALEQDPASPRHLVSRRGAGYALMIEATVGSAPVAPVRLPAERDAFVGRARDLERLEAALVSSGLVSLVGPAAVGKTRLAVHAAWRMQEAFQGRVWFCDLHRVGPNADPGAAVCTEVPGEGPAPLRLQALGRCVLVLDNIEQGVESIAAFARSVLAVAPEVTLLATGRRPLGLAEERVLEVAPLTPDQAVSLAMTRVREALPTHEPGPDEAELWLELARQVDGLPLGIEIAASRVPLLGVRGVVEGARRGLSSGRRDAEARHRSLDAAIGWSWELLRPVEQRALIRLASVGGPVTLEGAETLLDGLEGDPVELLSELADHRLVVSARSDPPSFAPLEVVRRFVERQPDRHHDREVAARTQLVGRAADLAALRVLRDRVVSLTGPPGVGKSRLAAEFSAGWPGPRVGVPLESCADADGIVAAVGAALDLAVPPSEPVAWLARLLRSREGVLWVFDDAEGCVVALRRMLQTVLDAGIGEGSRVLVTSRIAPQVGSQHEVGPLHPADARAMFLAEARRAAPGLLLDGAEGLSAVVERLDGLPLSIELAAARVSVLSLAQLRDRLSRGLDVLRSVEPVDARHLSLRAAIEVSIDLLTESQEAAWARCAVFRGGFELSAAEEVIDVGDDLIDDLHALRRAALLEVRRDPVDGKPRFHMLPSLAALAIERLSAADRDAAFVRHGRAYARLATEEALAALHGPGGIALRRHLTRERGNLVEACRRAIERQDGPVAARTAIAAWVVLGVNGPFQQALELLAAAVALPGLPAAEVGALKLRLGQAHRLLGHVDSARECLESAARVGRELDDLTLQGQASNYLGQLFREASRPEEAEEAIASAVALFRRDASRLQLAFALDNLGSLRRAQHRLEEARSCYEQALAIHRDLGNRRHEGHVLAHLGTLYQEQGSLEQARASYTAAHRISVEASDLGNASLNLSNLAVLDHMEGNRDALERLEAALVVSRDMGNRRSEATMLGNIGLAHLGAGRYDQARGCLEAALTIDRELRNAAHEARMCEELGRLEAAVGDLDAARAHYRVAADLLRALGETERAGELERLGSGSA